jgi:hypothetical protein
MDNGKLVPEKFLRGKMRNSDENIVIIVGDGFKPFREYKILP